MGWLDNILVLPGNAIPVHPTEFTQVYLSEMLNLLNPKFTSLKCSDKEIPASVLECFVYGIPKHWSIPVSHVNPLPLQPQAVPNANSCCIKRCNCNEISSSQDIYDMNHRHPGPEGIIFVYMRQNKGSWRIPLALVTARKSPPNYRHHFFIYSMASHTHISTLNTAVINVPVISFDWFFGSIIICKRFLKVTGCKLCLLLNL